MKKKLLAGILSLLVVLQLGAVAFADETTTCTEMVNISDNNVSAPKNPETYGITDNGDSVTIEGSTIDVKTEDGTVGIMAANSTVNIDDSNVSGSGFNDKTVLTAYTNCTIENSTISADGTNCFGIWNNGTSTININNSKVSASTSSVYSTAICGRNATVIINNSTISADGTGAIGIYDPGTYTINNSTISADGKTSHGIDGPGTYTINNSEVSASGENSSAVNVYDSANVTATGSTITGSKNGVDSKASNITVTDGSITGGYNGVLVSNSSNLTATGSTITGSRYGVLSNASNVTITDGSVTGGDIGVLANNYSNLTATGCTITGTDFGVAASYSKITVTDGSVTGASGVTADVDKATVIVLDTTVTATGTEADGDAALAVTLAKNVNPEELTIIVDKLEVTDDAALIAAVDYDENDITEDVAAQIYYIVNAIENATVSGDTKSVTANEVSYTVAKEGKQLAVKVADGYELVNDSQYASVVDNHDGTYTITVNRGGDLYFTARVKYVAPAAAATETYVESFLSGNQNDAEQPTMNVNMRASHLLRILKDGEVLDASNYMIATESHGLLTFQFTNDFIKSLKAGTYQLTFEASDSIVNFRLIVNEDGSYKVVY